MPSIEYPKTFPGKSRWTLLSTLMEASAPLPPPRAGHSPAHSAVEEEGQLSMTALLALLDAGQTSSALSLFIPPQAAPLAAAVASPQGVHTYY